MNRASMPLHARCKAIVQHDRAEATWMDARDAWETDTRQGRVTIGWAIVLDAKRALLESFHVLQRPDLFFKKVSNQ